MSVAKRFLILSADGIHAETAATAELLASMTTSAGIQEIGARLSAALVAGTAKPATRGKQRSGKRRGSAGIELIASIAEDSVKLVSGSEETMAALRQKHPGLRVVEETFCHPAVSPRPVLRSATPPVAAKTPPRRGLRAHAAASARPETGRGKRWTVTVVRADNQKAVRGAKVLAFTDFAEGTGAEATTAANGIARLTFPRSVRRVERLYVFFEKPGLWGHFAEGQTVKSAGLTVALTPIDLSQSDSLRHFHDTGDLEAGRGVRVGVIDSGVATDHPDIVVAGGKNCLPQPKNPDDYGAAGDWHGTHVAGIIAGRGTAPSGVRGLAPGAEIRSYRVFGKRGEGSGSSFAVIAAINQAIADRCDLINLSLSFGGSDPAVAAALRRARESGCLAVAAAGNDGRQPVSFPASSLHAVAVSAAGRVGTFPATADVAADIAEPRGNDASDFLGAFSNQGMELDFTGSGVGVVSTVPGGYAPLSGTSMACPAICGATARLLAQNKAVLDMPRDAARTDAIRQLAVDAAEPLGFGNLFEGNGIIR
jgi:subtilisin